MLLGTYKAWLLLIGDLAILWTGLLLTLVIRYGVTNLNNAWWLHSYPFSIVFAIWIIIFYISGLYELRIAGDFARLLKSLFYAVLASGIIAMALFYFFTALSITPRANLLLDIGITAVLLTVWRSIFSNAIRRSSKLRVLLLGDSPDIKELANMIQTYPQFGYVIVAQENKPSEKTFELLKTSGVDIVVAPRDIQSDTTLVGNLYETLSRGIRFMDVSIFYEQILGKIPTSLISKIWFLENIAEAEKRFFETAKRTLDIIFALSLGLLALILFPLVALCIKLDSKGPIFLRQRRVGKMGKTYIHYKYRTMIALNSDGNAELKGAMWSKKGDTRITRIGTFLRATRVDELPQVWNIIRGELSFVGPRPERPEFVNNLRREIPHYDIRHLIRPGLSGWAQINPPYYYASLEDTQLKLQYDLFYIKNRDLGLDLAIILKTLAVILSRKGR